MRADSACSKSVASIIKRKVPTFFSTKRLHADIMLEVSNHVTTSEACMQSLYIIGMHQGRLAVSIDPALRRPLPDRLIIALVERLETL